MNTMKRGSHPTILNVDDNEDSRTTLTWLLQDQGYHVKEASTGAEALSQIKDRPHLVVLDVVLPDQTGFEVCRKIKEDSATSLTPVVMLSGQAISSNDRVAGLEGGADAYLTKPVEPAVLMAHVKSLLRLRQAEEVHRRAAIVLDSTTDCVVALDHDWRYTYVNPQAERTLRRNKDELLGESLWDILPATPGSVREREYQRAVAERVQIEFEEFYPFLNAWLEVRAVPTEEGLSVFFRDVTARHRAAEALHLRDRAIQAVSQGILITDRGLTDDPIIYVSPGFERLTGYRAAEVLGKNSRFLQGADTDRDVVAKLHEAVSRGRECAVEILNYRKNGEPFWNQLTITPVRDGEKVTHFVGVLVDVTERRRLEAQFRHAQKMEAVGQLAGGIAHDFNNLLTIINGYGDMLLDSTPVEAPAHGLMNEIRQAGERAVRLTRQLLTFSRKAVVVPRLIDLNEVVHDLEKMLGRLIGEDVQFEARLKPHLGRVRADQGQLEQVIVNLVVNARDAMPSGGRLVLATGEVRRRDEAVLPAGVPLDDYVLLTVRDTGVGMSPSVLNHLFEPFFTTKGPGKGTGLGLATVHGIVQEAKGYVTVDSALGQGSTFFVYLPRVESADISPRDTTGENKPVGGNETVLLVEDEEAVRAYAATVLRAAGYRVEVAGSGVEAAARASDYPDPLDILVTDVVMPGQGGRVLAESILARRPGMKVLYLSGYTDDAVVRHGVREEQVNFLAKPFTPEELTRKVREVLDDERS